MSANIETQYVVNGKIFKSEEDARNYIVEVEREKYRRETLQKEKQNDRTGDLLYLNTDTHWTPRGARIAAKAIAEQVKKKKNLLREFTEFKGVSILLWQIF